jgi:predicted GTPase
MNFPQQDVVYNKLTQSKQTLNNEINKIKEQIYQINSSGKRIRAKMVKNLMENSVEGKNILKILKTNQVNLLK